MTKGAKYDPVQVGRALLLEVIGQGPKHLKTAELVGRIVADPEDEREVATAHRALRELGESALVIRREDHRIEPTRAALHADRLFGAA